MLKTHIVLSIEKCLFVVLSVSEDPNDSSDDKDNSDDTKEDPQPSQTALLIIVIWTWIWIWIWSRVWIWIWIWGWSWGWVWIWCWGWGWSLLAKWILDRGLSSREAVNSSDIKGKSDIGQISWKRNVFDLKLEGQGCLDTGDFSVGRERNNGNVIDSLATKSLCLEDIRARKISVRNWLNDGVRFAVEGEGGGVGDVAWIDTHEAVWSGEFLSSVGESDKSVGAGVVFSVNGSVGWEIGEGVDDLKSWLLIGTQSELDSVRVEVWRDEEQGGRVVVILEAIVINPFNLVEERLFKDNILLENRGLSEVIDLSVRGAVSTDESKDKLVISGGGSKTEMEIIVVIELNNIEVNNRGLSDLFAIWSFDIRVLDGVICFISDTWESDECGSGKDTVVLIRVEDLEQDVGVEVDGEW